VDRRESIPEAAHAGIVVGASTRDLLQGLAGWGRRAVDAEEGPVGRAFEVEMGKDPVLVEVAGGDPLLQRLPVEECLPAPDLIEAVCGERRRGAGPWRTLLHPAGQHSDFVIAQGRRPIRHAARRRLAHVVAKRLQGRARERAPDVQRQALGELLLRGERVGTPERKHAQQKRLDAGAVPALQDGNEAERAPLFDALRVESEPSGIGLPQAGRVVDRLLGRPPLDPLVGGGQQLTGRVVAGMARHAATLEHGPDIFSVAERLGRTRLGKCRQLGEGGVGTGVAEECQQAETERNSSQSGGGHGFPSRRGVLSSFQLLASSIMA